MRHALRVLGREKAFAAFAILTLALGIGAVTTIFSVVDTVLLKPLAYKDPGRLYAAAESAPKLARVYPRLPVNASHFRSWQEQCRSCESAALLNPASFNLTGDGEPERIEGATCTWPLFQVLGVEPQLGRTFVESDDQPGANKFVVVSDSLWRRRLGADPGVIGKPIQLDGEPHIVVGVLRADFRFPSGDKLGPLNQFPKHAEIFKPMGFNWAKLGRFGQFNFAALIRLRPARIRRRAEAEMTAAVADAGREMKMDLRAHLVPLQEQVTGGSRRALTLLLAAVGAVLLIVCVNLGNLMLVRANERARDAAIRRALGADAGQLFRPILAESLLIALTGGALGVLLAYAGVQILVNTAPVDIPRLDEVHVSLTTLLFAFCVSAGCGMLCGLWPAIRATGVEPADALRSGSRSATEGRARQRIARMAGRTGSGAEHGAAGGGRASRCEFLPGHQCRAGLCRGSHSHRRSDASRFALSKGRAARIVSSAGARKARVDTGRAIGGVDQFAAAEGSGLGRCHQQARRHAPPGGAAAGPLPLRERALLRNYGSSAACKAASRRRMTARRK